MKKRSRTFFVKQIPQEYKTSQKINNKSLHMFQPGNFRHFPYQIPALQIGDQRYNRRRQWMDYIFKKQQTGHEDTSPNSLTLASLQVTRILCAALVVMATRRVKPVQRRKTVKVVDYACLV